MTRRKSENSGTRAWLIPVAIVPAATLVAGVVVAGTSLGWAAPAGNTIEVNSAQQLSQALSSAAPGSTIKLAPGKYVGDFTINRAGNQGAPITLTGPRTAVLSNPAGSGGSGDSGGAGDSGGSGESGGAGNSGGEDGAKGADKKGKKKKKGKKEGKDDKDGKDSDGKKSDGNDTGGKGGKGSGAAAGGGYGLHLNGANYWKLVGFAVAGGTKGIVLDSSNHVELDGVEVSNTDQEAIHFRTSSSDNVVKNSVVHDTGKRKPQFGEAIYFGSAKSNWKKYGGGGTGGDGADRSDRNQALNNKLGPNVTAEHVDIKEGTEGGVVSGNTFNGHGISGENYADSWVDVKGNGYRIENNTGTFDGTGKLVDGYQTHQIIDGSGCGNTFAGNKSDLGPATGKAINITNQRKCEGNPNTVTNTNTG